MRHWQSLGQRLTGVVIGIVLAAPSIALDPPVQGAGHAAGGARFAPGHGAEPRRIDALYRDDAPGPDVAFRGCAWFEQPGYRGRRGEAGAGISRGGLGRDWNDRISSVACHQGCRLLASEDVNHGGARRTFRLNTPDLGPEWDNRISALRIVCTPAPGGAH